MFKQYSFPLLLRGIMLFVIGITLASCDLDTLLKNPLFKGTISGDAASVRQLQERLRTVSGDTQAIFYNSFQEDSIYLPDNYVEEITKDRESLMVKLIGQALWRNGYTYADIAKYDIEGFDEATFNYIKGAGGAWVTSLREDPKNAFVTERYELYKTRVGKNSLQGDEAINPLALRKLLRDDSALSAFLTDDDYAGRWLSQYPVASFGGAAHKTYPDDFIPKLGPANSGVLPNASP